MFVFISARSPWLSGDCVALWRFIGGQCGISQHQNQNLANWSFQKHFIFCKVTSTFSGY